MKRISGLKGISPLVATIMLIAFTMVVAGILASWASTFALRHREQIEMCSEAYLFIQNAAWNSDVLELNVWNSGTVNLTGFNILITPSNESTFNIEKHDVTVAAGKLKAIQVDVSNDIKQVVIRSEECHGAQDLILRYKIRGL